MKIDSRIYIAGHTGLVGSAVYHRLKAAGYSNLLTTTRRQVDLTDAGHVCSWFRCNRPEYIFLCAARVGGIKANAADPVGFYNDNIAIQNNVIQSAAFYETKKLLFLGSSCIYPRDCPQPIKEEYLLTGPIEKTTEAYALAKICGVKLCEWYRNGNPYTGEQHDFICAMPCNLFGPNDNFDPVTAHVVPGLMARMHAAKLANEPQFFVWGTPNTSRELLFSPNLADMLICLMQDSNAPGLVNTGSGREYSMAIIAARVADAVGYKGELLFNGSEPSGTPRKVMDNAKFKARYPEFKFMDLEAALKQTYEWYCNSLQ